MSTRSMSAAALVALQAKEVRLALLFEAVFTGGTIRFWTGGSDILWNGFNWTGLGDLIGVSSIVESSDVTASGLIVSLSGVKGELVSAAISESQQGAAGKVWLALLDEAGAIIADPVLGFVGRLDVPSIIDGDETCTISISYENRLIDLKRARNLRYTHESQQLIDPDDLGFEYVTQIQDYEVTWGR